MRLIKFRQPLYLANKFHRWHYWGFNLNGEGGFVGPVMLAPSQQYTDLKDKNGKEIYEGDILKSTATKTTNPRIKVCEWEGIGFDPFVADCEHSGDGWHWEIIGNIYQNSELIIN